MGPHYPATNNNDIYFFFDNNRYHSSQDPSAVGTMTRSNRKGSKCTHIQNGLWYAVIAINANTLESYIQLNRSCDYTSSNLWVWVTSTDMTTNKLYFILGIRTSSLTTVNCVHLSIWTGLVVKNNSTIILFVSSDRSFQHAVPWMVTNCTTWLMRTLQCRHDD